MSGAVAGVVVVLGIMAAMRASSWRSAVFNCFANAARDLSAPPPQRIPALDLLRSAAILLVMGNHAAALLKRPSLLARVFYWGWTGVDLFFVLSGFLIGRQLWRELERRGSIRLGTFILRRGLRIWPLYFCTVALCFAAASAAGRPSHRLWADLFCVSNYFRGNVRGGWSLSTEEQFYLLLPAALLLLSRFFAARRLFVLPLAWLCLLPVLRIAAMAHAPGLSADDVIYGPFHTHSDGLAAGLLIAWAAVFVPRWWKRRCSFVELAGAIVLIGLALVLRFAAKVAFAYSALGVFYGILTLLLLRTSRLPRICRSRVFYVMSRLSYGIYLNHFFLERMLVPVFASHASASLAFVMYYALSVLLSLAVAFVTFSLIERPFLQFRERSTPAAVPIRQTASLATA